MHRLFRNEKGDTPCSRKLHLAHKEEGVDELVCVGRSDKDDGAPLGDAEGAAGTDVAEEEVDEDAHHPEDEVVCK